MADIGAEEVIVQAWALPVFLVAYAVPGSVVLMAYRKKRQREEIVKATNGDLELSDTAKDESEEKGRDVEELRSSMKVHVRKTLAETGKLNSLLGGRKSSKDMSMSQTLVSSGDWVESSEDPESPVADDLPSVAAAELARLGPEHASEVQKLVKELKTAASGTGCCSRYMARCASNFYLAARVEKHMVLMMILRRQTLSDFEILLSLGAEAGLYLCCQRMIARFLTVCTVLYLPFALICFLVGERQDGDLANFTPANFARGSNLVWLEIVAVSILTFLGHGFAVFQWHRLQRLKYLAPEVRQQLRTSTTVMVRRFPQEYVDDNRLLLHMRQMFPADSDGEVVVAASVALDLHELIKVERELVHCLRDLKDISWASTSPNAGWRPKRVFKKLAQKYIELREEERKLRTTDIGGTGVAFVTFRHPRDAADFMAAHCAGLHSIVAPSQLQLSSWKVTHAPEPDEILWENLRISISSRRNRQALIRLVVLVVLLIGSSFVLFGVFGIGLHYVQLVYKIRMRQSYVQVLDSLLDILGPFYWAVFLLPLLVFFGVLASVPAISKKMLEIECHHTRSKVLESYVRKAFGFYLLINLVLTSCGWLFIVYNADVGTDAKARIFADLSGTFHVSLLLTECFIMLPLRAYRGWYLVRGEKVAKQGLATKLVGGTGMAFHADLIEEEGTVVWIGGIPHELLVQDSDVTDGANNVAEKIVWVGGIPAQLLGSGSSDGAEFVFDEDGESSAQVDTSALASRLAEFGRVTSMTVRAKPGVCRSWAFVTFADEWAAQQACAAEVLVPIPDATGNETTFALKVEVATSDGAGSTSNKLLTTQLQGVQPGSETKSDSGGSPRATGSGLQPELEKLLGRYGRVTSMTVRPKEGLNKSWAFVTFVDAEAAKAACAATLTVHPVDGKPVQLMVKPANVDEHIRKESTGALQEIWREQSAARTIELFDFSKQYAEIFSLLAMILAYGPTVPFLFPVGLLYFVLCEKTDSHILCSQFGNAGVEVRTTSASLVSPFRFVMLLLLDQ
eukprot:SAG31_NODE_69_length_28130_cov_15.318219_9_plen_1022_part_00